MKASNQINRKNNFDFIRLILASLVIVSHSFQLTKTKEILAVITNNQVDFGSLAVNCFFALSGYFIFISLKNSKTITNYIWKRLLRLYPALIVLLIFTFIVLIFLYSGENYLVYIKNFIFYAANCLSLYKVDYYISGIFLSNPYKGAINGSLWSLSYEFTMYILLVLLFFIKNKKFEFILLLFAFIISLYFSNCKTTFLNKFFSGIYLNSGQIYRLASYFVAGSLLTFLNLKTINTVFIRLFIFGLIIFSLLFNFYTYVSPIFIPIFVLLIGSLDTKIINELTLKIGDISYGVYIYGFLIQQVFMSFIKLNAYYLLVLSLPVSYILAYLSWHLVEKKMLKHKYWIK
ncbi:acyltransferase family protein [Halpernia frigidisoli]|uniref:Peptidoglycan/LPS O-acetylase OafA/YrhL, contains acyltransferase and SGNH-hydrolase domains n=1 Tax=Halpernia frigidisoli TaxID=1125876 RepID=A0A1I3GLU1_9FLAO|nr:acyltransferase [Halpernia frigidisoli]SFI24222.1 Peptidoglycan/LPS O-acetylase OafA/YrhL, contains acyltransferase and SGNH-hydrolase domains [Halpernia frigidisoli]